MELLKAKATRTRVSEIIYVVFNALLPVAVFFLSQLQTPYLALLAVILSKWRIFALRPRYWWANIKANMVDITVGVSVVGYLYAAGGQMSIQLVVTALYAIWLLVIKPRSGAHGVMMQAGIAQFVGLVTLMAFSTVFSEIVVLLGAWVIGYVSARHFISNYEEAYTEILGAIWGLFVVQLTWLAYRWSAVYSIGPFVKLPQLALVMLVAGFCAARLYHANKHNRLTPAAVKGNIIFGVVLIAIIIIFSPWNVKT